MTKEPEKWFEEKVLAKPDTRIETPTPIKTIEVTVPELELEKKRRALEEAKKLLGSSSSIELVPIKKSKPQATVEAAPTKILMPDPFIGNVDGMIQNDESNDELSEPPSIITLPVFEELANKNGGTGIRRKIGKGESIKYKCNIKIDQ